MLGVLLGVFEHPLYSCLLAEHEHIDSSIDHGSVGVLFGCEVHEGARHEQIVGGGDEVIEIRNGEAVESDVFPED